MEGMPEREVCPAWLQMNEQAMTEYEAKVEGASQVKPHPQDYMPTVSSDVFPFLKGTYLEGRV